MRQIYESLFSYETRLWLYKFRHQDVYRRARKAVHPSPKGDFSLKPFDEHHCIFVHITKTAGTSAAQGLFGYLPYHYTAIDYRVIYGRNAFNTYFKFAFVRNPWDRLYSAYRYLKAGGWNDDDRRWGQDNLAEFDNFNDFVIQWLNMANIRKHIHFRPQHEFVCDSRGRLLIDYLAYFETLEEDFRRIARHLKINAEIGQHNTNPGLHYRDIYNDRSRDIVAQIYSTDIQLFGYDFDGIAKRRTIAGTELGNQSEPS